MRGSFVSYRHLLLGIAITPLPLWGAGAHAQDARAANAAPAAARPAPQNTSGGSGLEEVVVTARRREEPLQKTPIAVTALTRDRIEKTANFQIQDVSRLAPNVAVQQLIGAIGAVTSYIRGIGSSDDQLSIDPPVGIYLDGVMIATDDAANFNLMDLDRIEVLRGPQGTLFGRNTTGGAINMVSKTPPTQFGAEEKFGFSSFDHWYTRTRIDTGSLGSTGLRATIAYEHHQEDGYTHNPYASPGGNPGAQYSNSVWFKLHGEWGHFRADYAFDGDWRTGVAPAFQVTAGSKDFLKYMAASPSFGGTTLVVSPDRYRTLGLGTLPHQDVAITGHSLTMQYEFDPKLTVKSISAYREFVGDPQGSYYGPPGLMGVIFKGVPAVQTFPLLVGHRLTTEQQFSQELQALGGVRQFSYVFGLYYFKMTGLNQTITDITAVLPGGLAAARVSSPLHFTVDDNSYAGYGQVSFKPDLFHQQLSLDVGYRLTGDSKHVDQSLPVARVGQRWFGNSSYSVSLSYQWTPAIMTYGRVATGYRSGGFNTRAAAGSTAPFVYQPETVTSYEVGFKAELFEHRLRANGDVFYTDYKDLQVGQYTASAAGVSGFNLNANATIPGFELEIDAVPIKDLTLSASVGYTHARYTSIFFPNPATGVLTNYASISNFGYVPDWTTHISADYKWPMTSFGRANLVVDYAWNSKIYFTSNGLSNVSAFHEAIADPGHGIANVRLSWLEIPLRMSGHNLTGQVSLWVENIADTDYRVAGIDFGSLGWAGNLWGPPREIGVDFKLDY
jgi:iron complex outermembrane receptor protein